MQKRRGYYLGGISMDSITPFIHETDFDRILIENITQ